MSEQPQLLGSLSILDLVDTAKPTNVEHLIQPTMVNQESLIVTSNACNIIGDAGRSMYNDIVQSLQIDSASIEDLKATRADVTGCLNVVGGATFIGVTSFDGPLVANSISSTHATIDTLTVDQSISLGYHGDISYVDSYGVQSLRTNLSHVKHEIENTSAIVHQLEREMSMLTELVHSKI